MTKKTRIQPQKTVMAKTGESKLAWFLFDAKGKTLGRMASEITKILRGKHKPSFTANIDCGDGVIIVNAEEIAVTGNKEATKIYRNYSGHVGGMKETQLSVMRARKPEMILETAIKKMMPRTRLAKGQLKRLRIFKGQEHSMDAQQPIKVNT